MQKYKTLLKNISVITIGQFSSKVLVFLLVPLYTNVLTTSEYGIYDLITASISLLIPILTLNIYSSTQRFSMDENADHNIILAYSFKSVLFATTVFLVVLLTNYCFEINYVLKDYFLPTFLLFFVECTVNVLSSFAVGINRVALVSISGAVATISMLVSNILFLLVFKLGLSGFFAANIISYLVQSVVLFFSLKIWKYKLNRRNKKLLFEMLAFCTPLIANNIAWWVNNVSDRFVVTYFLGVGINGIYSIGYKIPSVLNVFQTVFSQAWAISAVRSFDSDDKDGFFSKTYSIYNFGMVELCSLLILTTKIVAKIMYANEFYEAWRYVPFLLFSVLFGSLSGYLGGIFSANKESKIYARSTVVGAVSNFALNIFLVQFIGALGAAVATAISYIMIWAIRLISSKRFIKMTIDYWRDLIVYLLLVIQCITLILTENAYLTYWIQIIIFLAISMIYYKQFETLFILLGKRTKKVNDDNH